MVDEPELGHGGDGYAGDLGTGDQRQLFPIAGLHQGGVTAVGRTLDQRA